MKSLLKIIFLNLLQGFARGVTSIGDEALKAIVVAAEAVGETAADAGEAITQAVHDTFTEDNKILGMTGIRTTF